MSGIRLEVKLKQHTPLIHFQYDQDGASLRASEVKPKLDRFILTKLGQTMDKEQISKGEKEASKKERNFHQLNDYEKGCFIAKGIDWLIGKGEKPALDYKLKFRITEEPQVIDIKKYNKVGKEEPYPLFFGNMKKDPNNPDEYRKFSFLNNPFKAEFLCYSEDIQKALEEHIADFFMYNNLGTRQSKGFGSFFLDVSERGNSYYKKPDYKYSFSIAINEKTSLSDGFIELFDTIDLFYRSLRSGINISWGREPFYMKPMIFKYAKKEGLQWDKKSIKEVYYPMELRSQQNDHENPEILIFSQDNDSPKYLFKDLLGLSVLEEWKKPYNKKITKENSEIDRFRSPIIFKPLKFGNRYFVNIVLEDIPREFLDQNFAVKSNDNGDLSLKTYSKFNIENFIDFALNCNLISTLEFRDDEDHPKFKKLKRIYNELKNIGYE